MKIKGFELVNEDKVDRVINGTIGKGGILVGGLGADAPEELILAHYDKFGGFIRKNGQKVQNGSFWDLKLKKPKEKAEIKYLFRDVKGKEVVVPDGEEVPIEVKAAQIAKKENKKK